eukprot:gene9543-9619_t
MSPAEARMKRAYGYVFQAAALYPWRTIGGNISLPLEIMGIDKAERQRRICNFPADRTLDIRETQEFIAVANRVRHGLREGHSYD